MTKRVAIKCDQRPRRHVLELRRSAAGVCALGVLILGLLALGRPASGVEVPRRPVKRVPTAGHTGKYGPNNPNTEPGNCYPTHYKTDRYSYFEQLPSFDPRTPLDENEMRISFMGSVVPMPRRAQAEMSIFVEVGWVADEEDPTKGKALDQFVFDCGAGVCANYQAMGVGYGRMDKIFLSHLHGDHITDLVHIYCFGNGGDRKSPLYVWGHGPSGVRNPGNEPILDPTQYRQNLGYSATPEYYDDGTWAFCTHLRRALRWHTESQAFQTTGYESYPDPETIQQRWGLPEIPLPVEDDPCQDSYALVPIELDWWKTGLTEDGRPTGDNVAYHNVDTGVRITHFPVIHCRQGSMGYKLEWNGLTMIYTSDTKPETNSIDQAINKDENGNPRGVDVFIHEMAVAPEIWALKNQGLDAPPPEPQPEWWHVTVESMTEVQNSSHTPQGAFGYLLSKLDPRPRLTVATHFPVADDTVACALKSVQEHCPDIKKVGEQLVWSFDLMVLRVYPDRILQRRAVVNDFSFNPPSTVIHDDIYAPKYHTETGDASPTYQLDLTYEIQSTEDGGYNGEPTFRKDGY